MKKAVFALFFISMIVAAPCSAENLFDKLLYKNVFLFANKTHVLVSRITGKVGYLLLNNGKMVLLKGPSKLQFQAMYDVQLANQQQEDR